MGIRATPHRIVVLSILAAVGASAAAAMLLSVAALDDPWDHLFGHLTGAIPAALLVLTILRLWPPPRPEKIARVARGSLLFGLALFSVGGAAEAVAALGYDRNDWVSMLADVHQIGMILGLAGLLVSILGAGLSLGLAVLGHFGLLGSRWVRVAVAIAIALVALFFLGALLFGY